MRKSAFYGVFPLVLSVANAGCGAVTSGSANHPRYARRHDSLTPPQPERLGEPIPVELASKRPPLAHIERSGDPLPSLGLSIFTQGGGDEAALAQLLAGRLRESASVVSVQADGLGITASISGSQATLATLASKLPGLLSRPVSALEAKQLAALRQTATLSAAIPSASELCARISPQTKPAVGRNGSLEASRKQAFALGRLALGMAGGAKDLSAVRGALEKASGWPEAPKSDAPSTGPSNGKSLVVGGSSLAAAKWFGSADQALAQVKAWRRRNHPLHYRLGGGGSARILLTEQGACATYERELPSEQSASEASARGLLAALALAEAHPRTRGRWFDRLRSESSGHQLAAKLARHAGYQPQSETLPKLSVRIPKAWSGHGAAGSQALGQGGKEATLSGEAQPTRGQGMVWAALVTRCLPELGPEATGRWAAALASQSQGRVQGWLSATSAGFVAKAPMADGEAGLQRAATRLGDALGSRLWLPVGHGSLGAMPASSRERWRALWPLFDALPSLWERGWLPFGNPQTWANATDADLLWLQRDLRQLPLELVVRGPHADKLRPKLLKRLGPALSQANQRTCKPSAAAATWQAGMRTAKSGHLDEPVSYLMLAHDLGPSFGKLLWDAVFRGSASPFRRALGTTLVTAEIHSFGGKTLVRLSGPQRQLSDAEGQTRALLERVAKGALQSELKQAIVGLRRGNALRRFSQTQQLLVAKPPPEPTAAGFRAALAQALRTSRLSVVRLEPTQSGSKKPKH